MKTKIWIFLLAGLFSLCLAASIIILMPGDASTHAEISSQGNVLKIVDLRVEQEFTISTPDGGENTVTVKDCKIAVTEANCPDHYCMQRGFCNSGTQIVCLPNKLIIRFLGEQTVDGIVG